MSAPQCPSFQNSDSAHGQARLSVTHDLAASPGTQVLEASHPLCYCPQSPSGGVEWRLLPPTSQRRSSVLQWHWCHFGRRAIHLSCGLLNRCVLSTNCVLEAQGEVADGTHRTTQRCKGHLDTAVNELRLPVQYLAESSQQSHFIDGTREVPCLLSPSQSFPLWS